MRIDDDAPDLTIADAERVASRLGLKLSELMQARLGKGHQCAGCNMKRLAQLDVVDHADAALTA